MTGLFDMLGTSEPIANNVVDTVLHRVVRGTFVVVGHAPDGDSLHFVADDDWQYDGISGHVAPRFADDGSVRVRLEGIDAPELGYRGVAQPLATTARDALLAELGFGRVEYEERHAVEAQHLVRGTIVARSIDLHGRVIAYVLRECDSTEASLSDTVNAAMLARGTAYPLAYDTQPWWHRRLFGRIADQARTERRGVWALDRSAEFPLVDADSIGAHGALVHPKLFRRCIDYLGSRTSGSRMHAWLATHAGGDNDVVMLGRKLARLSAFVRESEGVVRTSLDPTRAVFVAR